jgi:O-antigen/teichoic acid export membrane protein
MTMIGAQKVPESAAVISEVDLSASQAELQKVTEEQLRALSTTALRGTAWNIGAYAGASALRLLSNILLTRLLVPQYFGVMALLNATITGLTLFSDLGLTPNIVRSPRGDEPDFLNTAWTMQVIRGIGLWICCLCLTVPFAHFYGQPQLRAMVPVIGFSLVISSFNSTSLSILSRRIAMRELSLIELSIQAGQLIFTVIWAFLDRSVWALIGGRLFADFARLVISHFILPTQRPSFHWEPAAARELFGFGRWVFFSTALTFLASQSDRMILGKLVSLNTLGLYGIAFTLSDIPRQVIQTFCGHIVFPFVSKLAHLPRKEFFALVLRYRRSVLLVASVILAVVVSTGDIFMAHIYDARYRDATWIVPILALGLWHTLLYNTSTSCLFAIGKPKYIVVGYLFSAIAMFSLTPVTFHVWGLVGFVWTVAFSDLPMYFVNLYGLGREHMLPAAQDLKATLIFLAVLGVLIVARYAAGFPFPQPVALH